jgi:hypothetical protein
VNLIVATLLGIVISLVLAIANALLCSLPVMWLWNAVAPDVFGLKPLTWLQALWLSLLCAMLFRTTNNSSTSGP